MSRLLLINDIPGASKVAANTNLPVLTTMGLETALLPTMILSSHMGYQPVIQALTDSFALSLNHIKKLNLHYEAMFTGYFAQENQIDTVLSKHQDLADRLYLDPIMGDGGHLYTSFDYNFVQKMRKLVGQAQMIFPNLTEASLLTQQAFKARPSESDLLSLSDALLDLGCQQVVITGVLNQNHSQIGFYYRDQTRARGKYYFHNYYPQPLYGTGDLAASLITGFSENQYGPDQALRLTSQLMDTIINYSLSHPGQQANTLAFEPFLVQMGQLAKEGHYGS